MPGPRIEKPVFVIGTGRCGSTIVFEALALHEQLGWFSNYNERFPRATWAYAAPRVYDIPFIGARLPRGAKKQYRQGFNRFNRYLPAPNECYRKWDVLCGPKFKDRYLVGTEASDEEVADVHRSVGRVLRGQKRPRFAAKITGPSRIQFLQSIFPDIRFVHVVRDAKAVVNSLLNVRLWTDDGVIEEPRWLGMPTTWEEEWESCGRTPLAMAAIQYRTIIETCNRERARFLQPEQYLEIRYEDFVADPSTVMGTIVAFCELPESPRVSAYVSTPGRYASMNRKYLEAFTPGEADLIDRIVTGATRVPANQP